MLYGLDRDIRLVSFDFDDTLIDTFGSVPARVRAAIASALPTMPSDEEVEAIATIVMTGDPELRSERLLAALNLRPDDPVALKLRVTYRGSDHLILPLAGAADVLESLAVHVPVVVISNGEPATQARRLHHHGLDRVISAVVCPADAGARKPDPAIFHYAAARFGVPPEHAMHIGDSLAADVAGANAAGFLSVLMPSAEPHLEVDPRPEPHAKIEQLTDLLPLLGLTA